MKKIVITQNNIFCIPAKLSWLSTLKPIVSKENGKSTPTRDTYINKPKKTAHKLIPIGVAKLRKRSERPY